jgi:HEAT repeats
LNDPSPTGSTPTKRNLAIAVVPVLLVLVTFLFWYQTWFGRRLSDADMGKYLADTSAPHETQHALSQLAMRVARGDPAARQWYPQVVALSENKESGLRVMAAWVMGQDNKSQEFHAALKGLLDDPDPMVRGNAALGLVRFGDASGRAELRAMLQPFPLTAPQAGKVSFRLKEQDTVGAGSIVARIEVEGSQRIDVHSPLAGTVEQRLVKDESAVSAGEQIAILAPGENQVWECLRALYLVGTEEDLPDVERYARGVPGLPARVQQQAALTAQAIRQRAGPKL